MLQGLKAQVIRHFDLDYYQRLLIFFAFYFLYRGCIYRYHPNPEVPTNIISVVRKSNPQPVAPVVSLVMQKSSHRTELNLINRSLPRDISVEILCRLYKLLHIIIYNIMIVDYTTILSSMLTLKQLASLQPLWVKCPRNLFKRFYSITNVQTWC